MGIILERILGSYCIIATIFLIDYVYSYNQYRKKIEKNLKLLEETTLMDHIKSSMNSMAQNAKIGLMTKQNDSIELLKNALLAHALFTISKEDLGSHLNVNYDSFDGTKLPHLSGCNLENALMSYIVDAIPGKKNAIDKYLDSHISTDDEAYTFLKKFLEKLPPLQEN